MRHLFFIAILITVSFFMYIPLIRRPLSEDEGNWFYFAVFWRQGVRLFKNFSQIYGYFGIPWIAAIFFNFSGVRKVRYFNYFKTIWYTCTVLSIYLMVYIVRQEYFFAFISALLFLIITSTPNTLFYLTYGEHFLILPVNMSILFSYYGFVSGNEWYFVAAGLTAGWAIQIKPTILLFCALLPCSYFFLPSPFQPLLFYAAALVGLNLLPLAILNQYGRRAKENYLTITFGSIFIVLGILAEKLKFPFLRKFIPETPCNEQVDAYIKNHYQKNLHEQWASIKRFLLPAFTDLYLVLILAAAQVVLLFVKFDLFVFCMVTLFLIYFITQQIQKNYYTPHINSCWAPISILAAKSIYDITPTIFTSGVLGWTLVIIIAIEVIRLSKTIIHSFSADQRDVMGFMGPFLGSIFRFAETIGHYIKQHSKETDKLLVWGDQPSIYLYSEREACSTDYLFLYAHHLRIHDQKEEHKFIDAIRDNLPEWILFYNYKVNDGWNIGKLSDAIGIPYIIQQNFRMNDSQGNVIRTPNGIVMDFPLYRRNDLIYKEVLLDKSIAAQSKGDIKKMQDYLNKVIQIFPADYEASLRLELFGGDTPNMIAPKRNILKEKSAEYQGGTHASINLCLLAEIDVREGNCHAAMKKYIQARDFSPDYFRTYNGLGEVSLQIGQSQQAFQFFKKALELNPYSADAYNNLGVMLAQDGQSKESLACFRKSLSIIPDHPDTLNNMAALSLTKSAS